MAEDDRTDARVPGERPGVNGNPLAPAFRDGPRRTPRSTASLVLEAVPFVALAGVVLLVVTGL